MPPERTVLFVCLQLQAVSSNSEADSAQKIEGVSGYEVKMTPISGQASG